MPLSCLLYIAFSNSRLHPDPSSAIFFTRLVKWVTYVIISLSLLSSLSGPPHQSRHIHPVHGPLSWQYRHHQFLYLIYMDYRLHHSVPAAITDNGLPRYWSRFGNILYTTPSRIKAFTAKYLRTCHCFNIPLNCWSLTYYPVQFITLISLRLLVAASGLLASPLLYFSLRRSHSHFQ